MGRNRSYARKARATQQRYSNKAGPVEVRQADSPPEQQEPLDPHALARVVAAGNDRADPRPRSHRRTWSPPGT